MAKKIQSIALSALSDLFNAVSAEEDFYLPVDGSDGQARFTRYESGMAWSVARNTVRSAKDFFFPQTQNLAEFRMKGKNIEILDGRQPSGDFVIFGVRACDARSFSVLDRVFLAEPVDSTYADRRAHALIVTVACSSPAETCFCGTFGIDGANPDGGDITAWRTAAALNLRAETAKGEAFLEKYASFFKTGDEKAVAAQQDAFHRAYEKMPLANLNTDAFKKGTLKDFFNSKSWASLSEACLGCGTCTFVCPTCQCYDIKDFNTGHGVKRFRCWDSCMYSDFTKMSAGQPRLTQTERFRQRFMHKLVYFPENNDGIFGCVGCGRCVAKCPIHMNIVKVMKTLAQEEETKK